MPATSTQVGECMQGLTALFARCELLFWAGSGRSCRGQEQTIFWGWRAAWVSRGFFYLWRRRL